MTKHRRKTHHRQITIAAVAIAAVGVPSIAMACLGGPQESEGRAHRHGHHGHHGQSASAHRWWAEHHRGSTPTPTPTATATASTPKPTPTPTVTSKPTPTPTPHKTTASPSAPRTATPAPSPSSGPLARIVELVNAERSKAGCSPVTVNAKLQQAAQDHSKDMAAHQNMSHTGSDGSSPDDRITRAGYNWSTYGENVAYGYETPEKVMAGWMSSPGHKRNILDCGFKEIGVGLAQPGSYWTQDFGAAR